MVEHFHKHKYLELFGEVFSGGLAGSVAEVVSMPLDTLKVRAMVRDPQLHSKQRNKIKSLYTELVTVHRSGGLRAFYGGLPGFSSAIQRQLVMTSVKVGCYDRVKSHYCSLFRVTDNPLQTPKMIKILSASTTGALAVCVGQPTDVVKVRTQAQYGNYSTSVQAYYRIYKAEGVVHGLWRGSVPAVFRNMAVNSAEIGAYDIIKTYILRKKLMEDTFPCFVASAIATGCIATLVASPADVIKTVYTNSRMGQYPNVLDCIYKIWIENGILAFYKGAAYNGSRLIVWNVVMFITFEYLRKALHKVT